jgi:hypothetical protein
LSIATCAVICELELLLRELLELRELERDDSDETLLSEEPVLELLDIELLDEDEEDTELPVELLLLLRLELERDEPVDDRLEDIEDEDIDEAEEEDDDCPSCPQTALWTQRRNCRRMARRSSHVRSWSK